MINNASSVHESVNQPMARMDQFNNSIFRETAIQKYMEAGLQPVLPRFIAPPIPLCLWLLAGILSVGALVIGLTPIPIYSRGTAIVVEERNQAGGGHGRALLVAFFPPEAISRLHAGQKIFLRFGPENNLLVKQISAVYPGVRSPDELMREFQSDHEIKLFPNGPASVAITSFDAPAGDPSPLNYLGSRGEVAVELGSRRVLSFFPYVGRFFDSGNR